MTPQCADIKSFRCFLTTTNERRRRRNKITNNHDNLSFRHTQAAIPNRHLHPTRSSPLRQQRTCRYHYHRPFFLIKTRRIHYQSASFSSNAPRVTASFSMSPSVIDIGRAGIFARRVFYLLFSSQFLLFHFLLFNIFQVPRGEWSFTSKVKFTFSSRKQQEKCAFSKAIIR